MKGDTVFKLAFNDALDLVASAGPGSVLPSENDLSSRLGVSRTTVRKVIAELNRRGFADGGGGGWTVAKSIPATAYFPSTETVTTSEQVEKQFMEWMLRADTRPGSQINELELARQFGVGTTGIREFLNRFRRFGLIEKKANAGWLFKGFTKEFAIELFEVREMFEMRSAMAVARLAPKAGFWSRLKTLERQHHELLDAIDRRFHEFSDLDNRFHRLINSASPNRFIDDFNDIVTLIFHYHYQWNKRNERARNEVAVREHLAYIAALKSQDVDRIRAACSTHLASARTTMLDAFSPD